MLSEQTHDEQANTRQTVEKNFKFITYFKKIIVLFSAKTAPTKFHLLLDFSSVKSFKRKLVIILLGVKHPFAGFFVF